MDHQRIKLEIGDTIEVLGQLFVLSKMEVSDNCNRPPRVTFIQPVEETEVEVAVKYCDLDFDKVHSSYGSWCTDHDLPAIHIDTSGKHHVCQAFARVHGCGCFEDCEKD